MSPTIQLSYRICVFDWVRIVADDRIATPDQWIDWCRQAVDISSPIITETSSSRTGCSCPILTFHALLMSV
jgi:hypothetical protein